MRRPPLGRVRRLALRPKVVEIPFREDAIFRGEFVRLNVRRRPQIFV